MNFENYFVIGTNTVNTKGLFDLIINTMKSGKSSFTPWWKVVDTRIEPSNEVSLVINNLIYIDYVNEKGVEKMVDNPYVYLDKKDIFKKYLSVFNSILRDAKKAGKFETVFCGYDKNTIRDFRMCLTLLSKTDVKNS